MAIAYPLAWPTRSDGSPIPPTTISLALAALSRSGGQAANGQEQVVASPAARWEGKIDLPALAAADIVPFRGFLAAMQGRVGTVLLPAFEAGRQPWPVDPRGRQVHPGLARLARLAGTIFAVDPAKDAAANIVASVALAPVNATALTLTVKQGGPVLPGHRFSLGQRLHEVMSVAQTATNADGSVVYAISVRPWLRAAVLDGAAAEFRSPVCLMRFKTDSEGVLELEGNRIAHPSLTLVEAF